MSLFGRFKEAPTSAKGKSSTPSKATPTSSSYDDDMDLTSAKTSIRDKQMSDWSQTEVVAWLETIDMHEHKSSFWENKITGSELPTLTEEDMKALGISKIGQRKKLTKEISKAAAAEKASGSNSASNLKSNKSSTIDRDDDGSEDSGSKDSSAQSAQVTLKLVYGKDIRAVRIPMDTRYSELRHVVKEQFGQRMRMKYKDEDGDYVSIRRQQDLLDMFSDMQMDGRTRQRIFVTPSKDNDGVRDKEDAAKAQAVFSMFDVLLDALIAINDEGVVQYCNASFEKLTGYVSKEVVNKNITVIMTEEYKRTHDAYLKTYFKTRTSKIIGVGRDVVFQKKDGSVGTVHLEVTEKLIGDKSYFFGTLKKPVDKVMKTILQMEREVLDRLVVPAIIIDHKGTIHGFNAAASTLLGYGLIDVVGRNINLLMTGMDKQNHDTYLKRYVETGKSKIIGVGRKVVAQTKDGALKPVMLSVTEKIDGDTRFFTGILQDPNAQ